MQMVRNFMQPKYRWGEKYIRDIYISALKSVYCSYWKSHEKHFVKIKHIHSLLMYSEVKHWSASCHMYRILLTSFFHFQKAKHILPKLQVYHKFEYIIRYALWLGTHRPNLLEKKIHSYLKVGTLSVLTIPSGYECLLRHN